MKRFTLGVLVIAALATTALADSVGPGGTWNGATFGVVKTPPLQNSDVFTVPISYHSTFAYTNWAGLGFTVGFDPAEVTAVAVAAAPGFISTGFGPVATLWSTQAINSGIFNGPSSVPFPVGAVIFHVTGSTPANNSDVDLTFNGQGGFGGAGFSPFNIFHLTSSGSFILPGSLLAYVPLPGTTGQIGQPVDPGFGTWVHVASTITRFLPRSFFFGTFAFMAGQGGIGVEHVPEPASAAMLALGLVSVVLGYRRR